MGIRSKGIIVGWTVTAVGGVWKAYSTFTTARDLKDDAPEVGKLLADPPFYLPWALMLIGIAVVAAFFWWRDSQKEPKALAGLSKGPLCIGDPLFVDCSPVTDAYGIAKTELSSVALCLQVWNDSQDGRTVRDLKAHLWNEFGDRVELLIRGAGSGRFDLRHGVIEFVEVGRVLVHPDPGTSPAKTMAGGWRHAVPAEEIASVYAGNGGVRSLRLSGNEKMRFGDTKGGGGSPMRITISAEDTPALEVVYETNLWADSPYDWLKRRSDA